MIRPLRQRHRRIVTALAVVLPLFFIAAILARRPVPLTEAPISKSAQNGVTNDAGVGTGAPR